MLGVVAVSTTKIYTAAFFRSLCVFVIYQKQKGELKSSTSKKEHSKLTLIFYTYTIQSKVYLNRNSFIHFSMLRIFNYVVGVDWQQEEGDSFLVQCK